MKLTSSIIHDPSMRLRMEPNYGPRLLYFSGRQGHFLKSTGDMKHIDTRKNITDKTLNSTGDIELFLNQYDN